MTRRVYALESLCRNASRRLENMVSEKVGSALESARQQMAVLEKNVTAAEKRATKAIGNFRGRLEKAPARLRKAFDSTAGSVRRRVAFATRAGLADISAKVEDLSRRVDALIKKRAKLA
ncbi:MAG: phasin family protein [Myxococcales bacterium]